MMFKNLKRNIFIVLLMFISSSAVYSAEKADALFVSGKVTDAATRKPIQGVNIQVEGFSSAITDEEGGFKIRIPFATALLKASAPGYGTIEISAKGLNNRNIKLYSEIFALPSKVEGVYQSSTAITPEEEIQARFGSDIRVIRRSGQQGVGANLFIRGYNSLNTNARPLIVVDGIIWDDLTDASSVHGGFFINPLMNMDANDIESIEVIKDATSVYGSKGANGAILIKTLRGKNETTRITFDASVGLIEKPKLIPVMNASEYRTYITDVIKNSGMTTAQISKLAFLNDDETSLDYNKNHNDTDWGNEVYGSGLSNRYSVKVQGGDEIALYGFSVSYAKVDGVLKGTNMNRLNTLFNSDIKLTKSLKVGTGILFSKVERELRDDGLNRVSAPGFISRIKSPLFNPYKFTTTTGQLTDKLEIVDDIGISNPLSVMANGIGMHNQYRFAINIKPEWEIIDGLKISSQNSYSINKFKEHYFIPVNGVSPVVYVDKGMTSYNVVKDQVMQQISIFSDSRISYEKTVDKTHQISAFAGYRAIINRYISDYGEGHNTGGDYVTNLLASLAMKKVSGLNDYWTNSSVYAHADYRYNDLYSVWTTVSVDNSSRFGSEAKGLNLFGKMWAVFPSVGADWLVSGEKFMKDISFINRMNVHASYGLTGNDNIGNNNRLAYLQSVNYMDKAVGLQIGNPENQTLQWETTRKLDGGFELSVLNDRLTIGAGVYQFKTSDLLTLKRNSTASGLGSYWTNEGEMQNTGYEVSVGLKVLNQKNFKWNLTATASHYQNEITALPEGDYITEIYNAEILTSVGKPAGVFYGYKALGVISTDVQSADLNLQKPNVNGTYSQFMAGDIQFEDVDENGIIDAADKQIIGNPNPDVTGAIFNTLSFGRFDLDVVFTYSYGNDIFNYQRYSLENMNSLLNQSKAVANRWIANGQVTSMPAAVYGDPMGNSRFSSRWIEDGSYIKLQNMKLAYQVPVKSNMIMGLTVWASASELLTFTKYLGSDPENAMSESVLLQGIDAGLLPAGPSYNVGIKLNL